MKTIALALFLLLCWSTEAAQKKGAELLMSKPPAKPLPPSLAITNDLPHLVPSPLPIGDPSRHEPEPVVSDKLPPLPPIRQAIVKPPPAVGLAWDRSASAGITAYRIYQSVTVGQFFPAWEGTGTNAAVPLLRGTNTFVATAIDVQGRESDYSNSVVTNGPPILRTNVTTFHWQSSDATGAWFEQGIAAGPFTNFPPGTLFYRIRSQRSTNDSIFLQSAPTATGVWSDVGPLATFPGTQRQFRLTVETKPL